MLFLCVPLKSPLKIPFKKLHHDLQGGYNLLVLNVNLSLGSTQKFQAQRGRSHVFISEDPSEINLSTHKSFPQEYLGKGFSMRS